MAESCRLLAVVPARGGSKRLPRKNVRPLAGKPLIVWTIEAAREAGVFDEVLVSTDDAEIAAVARAAGGRVPWLRPAELSTDAATSAAVLQHALAAHESSHGEVDAVVLLQPTSPLRRAEAIRAAVAQFRADPQRRSVVSVSPAAPHPAWAFTLDGATMTPYAGWELLGLRSQDLPPAYVLNGAIYVLPAETVREGGPLLRPGLQAYVMADAEAAVDIDTELDWELAEFAARRSLAASGDGE